MNPIISLDASHLEPLVDLQGECFAAYDQFSATQWGSHLTAVSDLCQGLFYHSELQAYALWRVVLDEAELLQVAVAAGSRGQGLAAQLLTAGFEQLRERQVSQVFLEVRASNTSAQRLYTGLGMQLAGRRKNYYPAVDGREDALLYTACLD